MKTTHPDCRIPRLRSRIGRCYELAARGVLQGKGWTLIHGEVDSGRPGLRIGHAWLERGDEVFCSESDRVIPADVWQRQRRPEVFARYQPKDLAALYARYGHNGPWHDDDVDEGSFTALAR